MRWLLFFLLPFFLWAKPQRPQVLQGAAKVEEKGSVMEVRTSDRAIIHWNEFSIDKGETLKFLQPTSHSAVLNRAMNGSSHINGLLQANGKVYLLNPNGILIGPQGNVQAAGFIASTLHLENDDFFKNRELLFKGNSNKEIVNHGKIEALGGDVFLFAKGVVNEGNIVAKEGIIGLAAGEQILLKPRGMQRIFIVANSKQPQGEGGIENRGTIEGVHAELRADGNIFRFAINQSGTIEATGTKEENGRVFLVAEKGTSVNTETLVVQELLSQPNGLFLSHFQYSREIFNQLGRIMGEMFQNLKTYDRFLFSPKCFRLGYDKSCYEQLFLPRGMVSSFDFFDGKVREILQQHYHNYQTVYVESF